MLGAVFHQGKTIMESTQTVLANPPLPSQLTEQVETTDGSLAIEVAVLFDNAVLAVHHLVAPEGGRLHRLTKGRLGTANEFSIGSAVGVSFELHANTLPSAYFPLVRTNGKEYEFLFSEQMEGELELNGKQTPLCELRAQAQPASDIAYALVLPIPEGARISLRIENCTFLIRSVPRPRRYPVPLRIDWSTQSYTAAVLAVAATLVGTMFAIPPDPRSLSLDSFSNEQLARYLVKAPEAQDEPTPWLEKQVQPREKSGGKAAKGPSGKLGKETAPKRIDAKMSFAGPKNHSEPKVAQQAARELASQSGILGILNSGTVQGLNLVMAQKSVLGNDAESALAALDGKAPMDAFGTNALGIVGAGHGGNGTGDNTIGTGPWGTIGVGGGHPGYGRPSAVAKLSCKDCGKSRPEVKMEAPTVINYDRELIRRVIRQHMNEVKFCYEQELTRDNNLSGRVVVKFFIGGMGQVTASGVESSTLRSGQTDQCIAAAVRRWEFPKPQQNGLVVVSYPFVLKTANE